MPDAIFAHPRLARVYDAFDGAREDLNAYRAIVTQLGARTVLDVGCGTGCLAHLLARDGITVIALDPAEASLVARAKDGAAAVTWIHGDTSSLPPLDVDLAVMTGNAAPVFVTDEDWAATLAALRTAVRRQGYFVFETRRPEANAWEEWAAETRPVVRNVPGVGEVEQRREVTQVDLPSTNQLTAARLAAEEDVAGMSAHPHRRDLAAVGVGGVLTDARQSAGAQGAHAGRCGATAVLGGHPVR